MQKPITILVSGAPGTGNRRCRRSLPTTLRERLGEAAALGTNEFYQLFDPRWTSSDRRLWQLAVGSSLAVACYLFQQGVQVVLIASNGLIQKRMWSLCWPRYGPSAPSTISRSTRSWMS